VHGFLVVGVVLLLLLLLLLAGRVMPSFDDEYPPP